MKADLRTWQHLVSCRALYWQERLESWRYLKAIRDNAEWIEHQLMVAGKQGLYYDFVHHRESDESLWELLPAIFPAIYPLFRERVKVKHPHPKVKRKAA